MTPFKPTHEITFTPDYGTPQVYRVMLVDGAAYSREEWDASASAAWERDDSGRWTCQGKATPNGAPGTVTVMRKVQP